MLGHRLSVAAFRVDKALPHAGANVARICAALVVAMTLVGCASFSPDGGMDVVTDIAATELKEDASKINSEESAAAAAARRRGFWLAAVGG